MTDYLPNKYSKRELTEKQVALLDNLPLANYDPLEAAKLAGYVDPYSAIKALRKELVEVTDELIANQALKAAATLGSVLDSDKPIMNLKEKIDVSKDILDRAGHAKKSIVDINHEVKGGVFILPEKEIPVIIEGEYVRED